MPTFATVAEGATDHAVLSNILIGFCKKQDVDGGDIMPVQPMLDRTGKQMLRTPGGWKQVLGWLKEKKYHGAFQFVDYVVVQIDTDICEEPGFDVAKCPGGVALPVAALIKCVREKLELTIGEEDLRTYAGRFHFAIAVHSIECWLLPLWCRKNQRGDVHTCKQKVDNALGRANIKGLRKDDVRTYESASLEFRKGKSLITSAQHQESLDFFLKSLESACA